MAQKNTKTHDLAVNGVSLRYRIAGRGAPVVLLHGYTQSSHAWLPWLERLRHHYTALAVDLRGAGGSSIPKAGYDKKTMAGDVIALLDSLALPRVMLIGHDVGAMVAYAVAAIRPDLVERLVLMEAPLPGIGPWRQIWTNPQLWHFHFHGKVAEALVKDREEVYFSHFWDDFSAVPGAISPQDRAHYLAAYRRPGAMRAGFQWFVEMGSSDSRDNLQFSKSRLGMPVLAVGGEHSLGRVVGDMASEVAHQATTAVVPGAAHWLLEEKPEATRDLVFGFLR